MPEKSVRTKPRKQPQQERSIQRVDAILAAATKLIADRGMSGLKMTEVAASAGVPIGSLYQYFPEKVAIVRALFDRLAARVEAMIDGRLAGVGSRAEALDRVEALAGDFYDVYRREPALMGIWFGSLADSELQLLNVRSIAREIRIFHDHLKPLLPAGSRIDLEARCNIALLMMGSAVRFAVSQDRETGDRLIAECKRSLRQMLFAEPAGE